MITGNVPFSELLRPRQLGDLTIPQRDIDRLQRMVDSKNVMNMIFYGEPGTGKTSAAKIMLKETGAVELRLNGSEANGIDYVRNEIGNFTRSLSVFPGPKICFIDEADGLTKNAQWGLRSVIEESSSNCRFLFTANHIHKLIPAIQSRMMMVNFDVLPADVDEIIQRLLARYETVLSELGVKYDPKRLGEIIGIRFPDLRSIANRVEYEFIT